MLHRSGVPFVKQRPKSTHFKGLRDLVAIRQILAIHAQGDDSRYEWLRCVVFRRTVFKTVFSEGIDMFP